ncbi:hypothetical protein EOS93_28025 [Rhizobium sp. RMa-01]|uniref:hypothetical protein n=1 Tax=unclassified Rhizobium TaxID=2613769 RepID=UPI0008D92090|nr:MULTISPECIES: hypothetical protein [unclassified Rhizobium]OHV23819.1 hypothetical protein BBJ66_26990 [Rhizobium sp. RSm-3]RVU06769.1 hypothetical protein EOS93_28025 [Rhizobium sp. RMa-01]
MAVEIWILGALFAGIMALYWLTPLGVPALRRMGGGEASPDLRFGYQPDETYRLLALYGPAGIAHFRRLLWIDMVFPGVYAAFFALLTLEWTRWVGASPVWAAAGVGCAISAGASDYIENILLMRVLAALPGRLDAAVRAASIFTRAKFVFSNLTLAIPVAYWLVAHLV